MKKNNPMLVLSITVILTFALIYSAILVQAVDGKPKVPKGIKCFDLGFNTKGQKVYECFDSVTGDHYFIIAGPATT